MATRIERRRFTVEDYHRMHDAGILGEDDRVELVGGEGVEMSPIGSRHAACVRRLVRILERQIGAGAIVDSQNPIRIDPDAEPQPDVAALRSRPDYYEHGHPTQADVLLIVEVSDTSLVYDRLVKLPLYAAAGIAEAWLVDLNGANVERHGLPGVQGYSQVVYARRGESLTSTGLPAIALDADGVLG
ncbi:MAG: Uma2 family endonuclease [Chloroflexi bacterium]|nr:Uma2 family endonuclease [Chloroflexota bacterium]